jgi:hypothetical protein
MPSFLELPRAANCESRSLVGQLDGKTIIVPLRCNSWGCVRCAAKMTTLWSHRVAEANPERMMTFTWIGETRDEIRLGLQQVIRDIRKGGFEIEYWGVIELTQKQAPHIHLVQRGSFIPKSAIVKATKKVGWGFSDIRAISSGWSAARYCAKHLCHSHGRRWDGRLIRYSKKFFTKDCAQGDLRDLAKEQGFTLIFGRADALADKYRLRGEVCEVSDLGLDWIMGEEKIGEEVVRRYTRDEKKGYSPDSLNYSQISGIDSSQRIARALPDDYEFMIEAEPLDASSGTPKGD